MSQEKPDKVRRRLLAATAVLGGATGLAALYPLLVSLKPQGLEKPSVEPIELDVGKLAPGEMMTVAWMGKPLWIIRRTPAMLSALNGLTELLTDPLSKMNQQPPLCRNATRSLKPEVLVLLGECTHLGCIPVVKLKSGSAEGMSQEWSGGFVCPCHGASFDLAGRAFKNTLAPLNLVVPPHIYLSDHRLLIGSEKSLV